MKRPHHAMSAAATEAPVLEEKIQLKTFNAETLSAKELRQFIARPRIDFTSILQKVYWLQSTHTVCCSAPSGLDI